MDEKSLLLKEKYNGVLSPAFEADSARLDSGEPLAYVIGWVPFLDCRIYLDSHPLIPRPETEYWAEKAIREAQNAQRITQENQALHITRSTLRVLDLFAGSGAIGVAVLKHIPGASVDFGEIDPSHFPTIRKNILENNLEESRTRIAETDVWSSVTGTYDFVLANPPYISKNKIERVQKSVLEHEPKKALFAAEEGFALIRKLIEGAPVHLNKNGVLYIEHEPEQAELLERCAKKAGFEVETHKDQYGIFRFSSLKAKS